MMTDEERLQFAVRFVEMDLATLRPGDWLNLREDLAAFIGWPPPATADVPPLRVIPGGAVDPAVMTPDEVRSLQEELRRCIRPASGTTGLLAMSLPFSFEEGHAFFFTGVSVEFTGNTRDLFFAQLLAAFLRRAPLQLRRCEVCGTLFPTRREQVYCSRPCSNRAAQRRFRARQTAATSS